MERDFRGGGLFSSFSSLLLDGCESFFSTPGLLKSKAVPGVLGVFAVLPKLAKAPLPNPKAEDAPVLVGDAKTGAELRALKGLFLLLILPKRLEEDDELSLPSRLSLRSDCLTFRLSLLLLLIACSVSNVRH